MLDSILSSSNCDPMAVPKFVDRVFEPVVNVMGLVLGGFAVNVSLPMPWPIATRKMMSAGQMAWKYELIQNFKNHRRSRTMIVVSRGNNGIATSLPIAYGTTVMMPNTA